MPSPDFSKILREANSAKAPADASEANCSEPSSPNLRVILSRETPFTATLFVPSVKERDSSSHST